MLERRDREKARAAFESAIRANPHDSFSLHKLGLLYLEEYGDRDNAERLFRRAIEVKPHNAAAYCSLGTLLKKTAPQDAVACFHKSLEYDPRQARTLKNLGLLFTYQFKEYATAQKYFRDALTVDPGNASIHVCMGQMFEEKKNRSSALQSYVLAVTADPEFALAHFRLGKLETNPQAQFEHFLRAVEANPADINLVKALANKYAERKDLAGLRKCIRTAHKFHPRQRHSWWYQPLVDSLQVLPRSDSTITMGDGPDSSAPSSSALFSTGQGEDEDYFDFPRSGADTGGGSGSRSSPSITSPTRRPFGNGSITSAGSAAAAAAVRADSEQFTAAAGAADDDDDAPAAAAAAAAPDARTGNLVANAAAPPASDAAADAGGGIAPVHCPIGHIMARVEGRPVVFESAATWSCEECSKSITRDTLEEVGAWHCVLCKYELCGHCIAGPKAAHIIPDPPRLIGEGGFGRVYREYDKVLREYVAVKRIPLNKISQGVVEREYRLQRKCRTCEHIVRVLKFIRPSAGNGECGVAMELMHGSVGDRLLRTGPMHEAESRRYVLHALRGLMYLHTSHPMVLHRDIKPDNMLLTGDNVVKLSDFGLSKHAEPSAADQSALFKGTKFYIAPELFDEKPKWTYAIDVWALGCAWAAMAYGGNPWDGVFESTVHPLTFGGRVGPQAPNGLRPRIPPFFSAAGRAILSRFLDRDYRMRPTAAMLLADPYFAETFDLSTADGVESSADFERRQHAFFMRGSIGSQPQIDSSVMPMASQPPPPKPAAMSPVPASRDGDSPSRAAEPIAVPASVPAAPHENSTDAAAAAPPAEAEGTSGMFPARSSATVSSSTTGNSRATSGAHGQRTKPPPLPFPRSLDLRAEGADNANGISPSSAASAANGHATGAAAAAVGVHGPVDAVNHHDAEQFGPGDATSRHPACRAVTTGMTPAPSHAYENPNVTIECIGVTDVSIQSSGHTHRTLHHVEYTSVTVHDAEYEAVTPITDAGACFPSRGGGVGGGGVSIRASSDDFIPASATPQAAAAAAAIARSAAERVEEEKRIKAALKHANSLARREHYLAQREAVSAARQQLREGSIIGGETPTTAVIPTASAAGEGGGGAVAPPPSRPRAVAHPGVPPAAAVAFVRPPLGSRSFTTALAGSAGSGGSRAYGAASDDDDDVTTDDDGCSPTPLRMAPSSTLSTIASGDLESTLSGAVPLTPFEIPEPVEPRNRNWGAGRWQRQHSAYQKGRPNPAKVANWRDPPANDADASATVSPSSLTTGPTGAESVKQRAAENAGTPKPKPPLPVGTSPATTSVAERISLSSTPPVNAATVGRGSRPASASAPGRSGGSGDLPPLSSPAVRKKVRFHDARVESVLEFTRITSATYTAKPSPPLRAVTPNAPHASDDDYGTPMATSPVAAKPVELATSGLVDLSSTAPLLASALKGRNGGSGRRSGGVDGASDTAVPRAKAGPKGSPGADVPGQLYRPPKARQQQQQQQRQHQKQHPHEAVMPLLPHAAVIEMSPLLPVGGQADAASPLASAHSTEPSTAATPLPHTTVVVIPSGDVTAIPATTTAGSAASGSGRSRPRALAVAGIAAVVVTLLGGFQFAA